MIRRVGLAACALVLLAATTVAAQHVVTGTVVRVDPTHSVVVFDNGQMYQATPQTVFIVNNQPTNFATIAPGTPVVVRHGQPVVYRDGRYVVMSQPAGTVVTAPAPVVATAPYEVSGVVKYADEVRRGIRFEDGRYLFVDEAVQLLANGAPVALSTVKPGTFVVARSTKPFSFRDNTYSVTTPGVVTAPAPVVTRDPVSGTVVRVDQPNLIVLSDGRVIPATVQTVVMVDNRAVPYTALHPGSHVVIYPNGQAAGVTDPYAFPRPISPEAGLREKEIERNAP
jgi:hypothetical protein